MSNFENVEPGTIALIQQESNGRIVQIGLTESQSNMLQFFLAKLSEGNTNVKVDSVVTYQIKDCDDDYGSSGKHYVVEVFETGAETKTCLVDIADFKQWLEKNEPKVIWL